MVKKREYPEFLVSDLKDLNSLLVKLRQDKENPLYQNFSRANRTLIDNLVQGQKIKYSLKKSICQDLNRITSGCQFYKELVKYYGRSGLYSKLSPETKKQRKELAFLDETKESLSGRELNRLRWLNIHILSDIYSDEICWIKRKTALRAWVESGLFALIVVTFLKTFFFQMYKIPTRSMVPVLKPKDKIFVTKLVYGPKLPFSKLRIPGFGKIKRGDVVVFVPPREVTRPWYKRRQFVKRLIGLPGERISIADGNIYINGEKIEDYRIDRNYYRSEFAYGQYATEGSEVLVPQGKYFFLGDNSSQSQDSREWGWADQEWIVGKALFLWWPPKRVGKLR